MNPKQKALLETIPVKKHDPDGVSIKMIMDHTGMNHSTSSRLMHDKIESGEAVPCWVRQGDRFVQAMKLKPSK